MLCTIGINIQRTNYDVNSKEEEEACVEFRGEWRVKDSFLREAKQQEPAGSSFAGAGAIKMK